MTTSFILTDSNNYSLINNTSELPFIYNVPGQIEDSGKFEKLTFSAQNKQRPKFSLNSANFPSGEGEATNQEEMRNHEKKQSLTSTSDKDFESPGKRRQRLYSQVVFEMEERKIRGSFKGYENITQNGRNDNKLDRRLKLKNPKGIHFMRIIMMAKRFVRKLKLYAAYQKMKAIPSENFDLIDDPAWFRRGLSIKLPHKLLLKNNSVYLSINEKKSLYEKLSELWKWILRVLKYFDDKIPILMRENNYFTLIFDVICFFCLLFNVFFIPLDESFSLLTSETTSNDVYSVILFSLVIFFLEIIIYLNTAFFSKGYYIFDRRAIFKNYIKTYFLIDLITIPPYILGLWFQNQLFSLIFVVRFYKIKTYYNNFKEFFLFGDKLLGLVDFSYLLLQVLFITHFSACLWHTLGMSFHVKGIRENWLFERGLVDATWGSRYVNAFYWSITTMLTVGYGDIVPINGSEKTFTIVVIVFSSWLFGYSLNRVGEIFKNMFKKENEYKYIMEDVNKFLKIRKINKNLQSRIQRYIEYVIFQEETGKRQLDLLNQKLSNKLKEELTLDIYKSVVRNFSLLYKNFSPEFLKKIALRIKEVDLAPDDLILEEGKLKEPNLYYVMNGEIELFANISGKKAHISLIKKNSSFGEELFFGNGSPRFSACSVNISKLCIISLSDFLNVLNEHPKDYEVFCKLKDDFMNNLNQEPLELKCQICNSKTHLYHRCPQIKYVINKREIVRKKKADETQIRVPMPRSRKKKHKSTKILRCVNDSVSEFQKKKADVIKDHQEYITLGEAVYKIKNALNGEVDLLTNVELATLPKEEMMELYDKISNNLELQGCMEDEDIWSQGFDETEEDSFEGREIVLTGGFHKIRKKDKISSQLMIKRLKTASDLTLNNDSPKNILKRRYSGESPKNNQNQNRELEKDKKISNTEKTNVLITDKPLIDLHKEYKIYFPHNNLSEVLKKIHNQASPKVQAKRSYQRVSRLFVRTNFKGSSKQNL